ncbi:DNA alkylation repair protein [Robertmurraya massiliosenegalensis]|uniref:DNA alkylation repair protein n=1 Tax=Robertmurraya TaxID=2837507 RepID=UPI0039A725B0
MDWVVELEKLFEKNRNEEHAGPMEKYMRDQFPYLGIKTPERKVLLKEFFQTSGILNKPLQQDFILSLWEKDAREYQYAALFYLEKMVKKLQRSDLELLENLITTKSWWDTVDTIAPKLVGYIATKYPEVIPDKIEQWAISDDIWLRRTAILFQLKYKERTNEELLSRYIKENAQEKEFFIRKAIGWALREYSKTNPQFVRHFIETTPLSNLSIREGSKYI